MGARDFSGVADVPGGKAEQVRGGGLERQDSGPCVSDLDFFRPFLVQI